MKNALILALHALSIHSITLFAFRLSKEVVVAWLALLALCMNLFVFKQMHLFGLNVTCSDALTIGYLLGLNLIQEFFGKEFAQKTLWTTLFISLGFLVLCELHLAYTPSSSDSSHALCYALFTPLRRTTLASLFSFMLTQFLDIKCFSFLRRLSKGRYLALRILVCSLLSQLFDTLIFSFFGLAGLTESISEVILFSLIIKVMTLFLLLPSLGFTQRLLRDKPLSI